MLSSLTAQPGHCHTPHSVSRLHEAEPVLRSCQAEQIALSPAGRALDSCPPEQTGHRGTGPTPGCSCQIVCWADHPDFRRFQISGINYLLDMSLSLLLSSLRETNFVRLKAAWMSLQMTCSVSRRKPVKDSLGGFCSSLSPVPQKHLSSPVHERLVFALNQTQMFTTHFRRKRVGSQHPSFCPPALPLLCTRTNLFSRSTILFFSSSEKCYSCTLIF